MQIIQCLKTMLTKLFQWKSVPAQTLKITMLGCIGVGKTSLLAAIYDQFDQVIGKTNLQIQPTDDASRIIIEQRLEELKSLVGNTIRVRDGILKSTSPRSFFFDLCKTGLSASLRLQFQDYPGEYIDSQATVEQIKTVENFIRESAAVLIAIDTPIMMEMKSKWHEKFNQPTRIRNLFKAAYQNLDSPRLVILAPVKCESYVQNDKDASELLACIREKYATLLDYFSNNELLPKVAVVVTPVQTVGSVFFSRVEIQNNEPCFYFIKHDPESSYKPKDSEQPLRYLLRFLLRLHLEKRRVPILNSMLNRLGKDVAFKEAVLEFTGDCKTTGGFAVLQGASLLRIDGK